MTFIGPLAVFSAFLVGAAGLAGNRQRLAPTTVTSSWGLKTVSFQDPLGQVEINLPADIGAGEAISGSFRFIPVERDGDVFSVPDLKKATIEVLGRKTALNEKSAQWFVPADATSFTIILRDSFGRQIGRASIPVLSSLPRPRHDADAKPVFHLPRIAQSGKAVQVFGPFDGNSSNTLARVGNSLVEILAESPRQTVLLIPREA